MSIINNAAPFELKKKRAEIQVASVIKDDCLAETVYFENELQYAVWEGGQWELRAALDCFRPPSDPYGMVRDGVILLAS